MFVVVVVVEKLDFVVNLQTENDEFVVVTEWQFFNMFSEKLLVIIIINILILILILIILITIIIIINIIIIIIIIINIII